MCFYKPLVLLLTITTGTNAVANEAEFRVVDSLVNKVCPADRRVFESQAASSLSCICMAVETHRDCIAVSYHRENRMCYGCDTFVDVSGQFPSLTGAVFYRRLNALPGEFVDVAGHAVLIEKDQGVTYGQADSACAEFGTLFRIDTQQKMDAIRNYLKDPTNGLQLNSYWVQCKLDTADGVWKFDDGTAVSMSNAFWFPGEPANTPFHHCGYLHTGFGFALDNYDCSMSIGYICEFEILQ